jgi:hypothetical protein
MGDDCSTFGICVCSSVLLLSLNSFAFASVFAFRFCAVERFELHSRLFSVFTCGLEAREEGQVGTKLRFRWSLGAGL